MSSYLVHLPDNGCIPPGWSTQTQTQPRLTRSATSRTSSPRRRHWRALKHRATGRATSEGGKFNKPHCKITPWYPHKLPALAVTAWFMFHFSKENLGRMTAGVNRQMCALKQTLSLQSMGLLLRSQSHHKAHLFAELCFSLKPWHILSKNLKFRVCYRVCDTLGTIPIVSVYVPQPGHILTQVLKNKRKPVRNNSITLWGLGSSMELLKTYNFLLSVKPFGHIFMNQY